VLRPKTVKIEGGVEGRDNGPVRRTTGVVAPGRQVNFSPKKLQVPFPIKQTIVQSRPKPRIDKAPCRAKLALEPLCRKARTCLKARLNLSRELPVRWRISWGIQRGAIPCVVASAIYAKLVRQQTENQKIFPTFCLLATPGVGVGYPRPDPLGIG